MSTVAKTSAFDAIKITEFRHFIIGRFLFVTALRMMGTLVGWWVYELTHSVWSIGLIGLVEVIPALGLALYAGHVIDVNDKRKILLSGAVSYVLIAFLLCLLSTQQNVLSSNLVTNIIYVLIFITGVLRAFTGPSFGAILSFVVPKQVLPAATTWSQASWLTASVTGHALVGLFIALFGITTSLIIITFIAATGVALLFLLKSKPPENRTDIEQKTWSSIKEGVNFVFKTKEVLASLSLDLFAVLFGGVVALIPAFAKDILHVGPQAFGWLNAATDIGTIVSVLSLTFFPLTSKHGKKLLIAVAGFGLCIIGFALSNVYWLSFIFLLMSGILDGISVVIRGTILQLKTPAEIKGRVMSVSTMFISSSNELGQFESGAAASILGLRPSVIFGGCVTLGVVVFTWFKVPSLKNMEY